MQTLFAWFFILVIAFRFIPTSVISRPVSAVWMPLVQEPWYRLPYKIRITVGWFCLLAIVFGSAFGFKLTGVRGDFILFFGSRAYIRLTFGVYALSAPVNAHDRRSADRALTQMWLFRMH